MADGDVRGAVVALESDRAMPRRRGTGRKLKPGWNVSPGADTQIADREKPEALQRRVHDDGGAVRRLKPELQLPRRRGTDDALKPGSRMSPGADTQIADRKQCDAQSTTVRAGGGGTDYRVKPGGSLSPAADTQIEIVDRCRVEAQPGGVHDGGGGTIEPMEPGVSLSPAADIIAAIVHLQRQRRFCIRTQSRTDRSTEAFIARECLGYHTGLPPDERKALMGKAQRIRLVGEKPLKQAARGGRSATEPHGAYAPGNGRDQISCDPQSVTVPSVDPVDQDDQVVGGDRLELGAHVVHAPNGAGDRSTPENRSIRVPGDDGRDHQRSEAQPIPVLPVDPAAAGEHDAAGDHVRLETQRSAVPGERRGRVRCETRPLAVPPLASPEPDAQDAGGDQPGFEAHAHAVPTSARRDREKPDSLDDGVPPLALPIIQMSYLARTAADGLRKTTEREMERLAASLHVAVWQAKVHGFGRLGLAIIVAEAGRDLRCYPKVAKLWKRLGLAVIDGERQRRKTDADLAALHGYAPHRRAEMWTLADSMFRHQWKSGGEDGEGSPAGPYGEVYAHRRARTAETHPEWTKAHCRDDARRVMFKALVADLWGAWHGRSRP